MRRKVCRCHHLPTLGRGELCKATQIKFFRAYAAGRFFQRIDQRLSLDAFGRKHFGRFIDARIEPPCQRPSNFRFLRQFDRFAQHRQTRRKHRLGKVEVVAHVEQRVGNHAARRVNCFLPAADAAHVPEAFAQQTRRHGFGWRTHACRDAAQHPARRAL